MSHLFGGAIVLKQIQCCFTKTLIEEWFELRESMIQHVGNLNEIK